MSLLPVSVHLVSQTPQFYIMRIAGSIFATQVGIPCSDSALSSLSIHPDENRSRPPVSTAGHKPLHTPPDRYVRENRQTALGQRERSGNHDPKLTLFDPF